MATPHGLRPRYFVGEIETVGQQSLNKLRVAHVSPSYFAEDSLIGGGERYVSYVARALREASAGLDFSLEQAVFALGERELAFSDGGVPVRVLVNENPQRHAMAAMSGRLWGVLADYDVLHIHQGLTFFGCYCTVIGRSLGKTVIITDLGGGENRLMLDHGGLALADGIISISDFARAMTRSYFKGPHISVIGPVDTDLFTPAHPPMPVPARQVLSVGRLLPHKGADRIIDALPDGLALRLVGRPYDPDYFVLLQKRAEGRDVTFVTDADDDALRECYHRAGLYVHASTFTDIYGNRVAKPELMGLTTLEALSSGVPVAVANTASLPELAPDGRFSRVFDDVAGLRRVFDDFAGGVWPGPDAGMLARQHTVAHYSFKVVGRRIADFYAETHAARLAGEGLAA